MIKWQTYWENLRPKVLTRPLAEKHTWFGKWKLHIEFVSLRFCVAITCAKTSLSEKKQPPRSTNITNLFESAWDKTLRLKHIELVCIKKPTCWNITHKGLATVQITILQHCVKVQINILKFCSLFELICCKSNRVSLSYIPSEKSDPLIHGLCLQHLLLESRLRKRYGYFCKRFLLKNCLTQLKATLTCMSYLHSVLSHLEWNFVEHYSTWSKKMRRRVLQPWCSLCDSLSN